MSSWPPRPVLGEIPRPLGEALAVVLLDLQGARPIELRAGFEQRASPFIADECDSILWVLEPDGGGCGFHWFGETGAELLVRLADHLQEQLFPETRQAWGEARPPCPGHTHPAVPVVTEGEAWWTCPRGGDPFARFGTLGG